MIEGDLLAGPGKRATEVANGEVRRDGGRAVAKTRPMYVDPRFPKAHRHRAASRMDRVELRLVDGQWRVVDVRFAGDRSLAAGLEAFLEEGRRTCGTR